MQLTHRECDNRVCRRSASPTAAASPRSGGTRTSTTRPTNGSSDEFAAVPMTFFKQMRRCVAARPPRLGRRPRRAAARLRRPAAADRRPVRLLRRRRRIAASCPRARQRTYDYFDHHQPGRHALHELPGYSHLDVFMGKNAARDVFPLMLAELDAELRRRHARRPRTSAPSPPAPASRPRARRSSP